MGWFEAIMVPIVSAFVLDTMEVSGWTIIDKMLGHSQPQTTLRYAHLAPDPVKAAAAAVAGSIDDAMRRKG